MQIYLNFCVYNIHFNNKFITKRANVTNLIG